MNINEAQNDMRESYFGGAPGVFASGTIWLVTGIVAIFFTKETSLMTFFFGGMLIHPIGIVLSKILKRSGKHKEGNPLLGLALESTFLLFVGLFIAFSVFQIQENWFFSIMLMIIGGRYLIFKSIYGMRVYWIFGLVLSISGVVSLLLNMPFYIGAIIGGVIEIIFAIVILRMEMSSNSK